MAMGDIDHGTSRRPRVVIVGAGFGGLYAARALRRLPVDITLIDRRNHHLFQPLLYQVATAALAASDIAAPIRKIFRRHRNVTVLLAEARSIDLDAREVICSDHRIAYDYLVLATGATHSYFGHPEWASDAPGLKTIEDALDIRRRVLVAYEAAELESDPDLRAGWLTFVIVGGGPTGVELAGALAEISRHVLAEEFRHIDPTQVRIILAEGLDRVLPTFPPKLSDRAARALDRLGVEVRTNTLVTEVDDKGVNLGEERIPARTVLWAAGVIASPLGATLEVPLDAAGRVPVEADLTLPGRPEVFVIGDLAALTHDGKPVPGMAPAAMQEGRQVAENIARALDGRPYEAFRYVDKGMLATIGRARAVADLGRLKLSGFPAWVAWLLVHIYFLIGFRNRLAVMLDWAWAFVTHERGARLITGPSSPPARRGDPA